MKKLALLISFFTFATTSYSQISVTPNSTCAGSGSFQVTITGFTPGQIPASTCGNATTGGLTNGSGTVVVSASNFVEASNTMTATLSVPGAQAGGTYGFKITFGCGSSVSCTNCFTVNKAPSSVTVSPSGPLAICPGGSTTLTCNSTGATSYQWKNGTTIINNATSSTYSATAAGDYSCVATNNCGSTPSSNSVVVSINAVPIVSPTATQAGVCPGGSSTLAANATAGSGTISTYIWSTGLAGNVSGGSVTPPNSTTYVVTVTNSNSCSASGSVNVTVNSNPVVNPSANPASACAGGSTTLTANATAGSGTISTYAWSSGLAGNVSGGSVSPVSATTYTVTVTNSNSCSASGSVLVGINANPSASPAATLSSVCVGGATTIAANASAGSGSITNYAWSSGLAGNVSGGSVSPVNTTTYTVTVTNSNTCTASASVSVAVNAAPMVQPSATPAAICNGGSSLLQANATAGSGTITGYLWSSGPPQNAPSGNVSPSSATLYTITVTNSNSCTASAAVNVTVGSLPVVAPTANPSTLCAGENSTLAANATAGSGTITNYTWSSGPVGNIAGGTVTPLVSTTYVVTVANSDNCTATGSATVLVNAAPVVGLTATPQAICNGGSSLLESNASAGSGTITSISWSSALPQNLPAGQVTPSSATTYTVTVTNSNNCSTTGSTTVSVGSTPTVAPTATVSTVCAGATTTLAANATAGSGTIAIYEWSTGLAGNVTGGDVNPTVNTTYTVTVTNTDNCIATGSVSVDVNAVPIVNPTATLTELCRGGSSDLDANATAGSGTIQSYAWNTGIGGSGGSGTVSPANTTTYVVSVSNSNNCSATGSITVTVNDTPTVAPTVLPGIICEGESSILAANAVTVSGTITTYAWSSGIAGNIDGGVVSPAGSTSYSVTVTNSFNCSVTGTTSIDVNPLPVLASSLGSTFCNGDTSTITIATTYDSYNWTTGDTTASIKVSASGTYSVSVTAVCGAMSSSGLLINVSDPGVPTIEESTGPGLIAHSSTAVTYEWFLNGSSVTPASADSVLSSPADGSYTVKITDAAGCTAESAPYTYIGVGIKKITSGFEVSFIPNPAKNTVLIKTNLEKGFTLTVLDINGQLLTTLPAVNNNLTLDVSKFMAGVYLLKISNNQTQTIKKLFVE